MQDKRFAVVDIRDALHATSEAVSEIRLVLHAFSWDVSETCVALQATRELLVEASVAKHPALAASWAARFVAQVVAKLV